MSDRVAIMRNGTIIQIGTPSQLYDEPNSAYIARFLGESNLLPVQITSSANGQVHYQVQGNDAHFVIPADRCGGITSGPAQLLVRPESLRISQSDESNLRVTVEEVVYLGELTATKVRFANGQEGWLRAMRSPANAPGDVLRVTWRPEDSRLLPAGDEATH